MNICPELRLAIVVAVLCGVMPAGERPAFEVISIRQHTAASGPVQRPGPTPNGFRSIGLPLIGIFQWAYPRPNETGLLRGDLIEGAPHWLSDETWDIVAKVGETDLTNWQKPEMRQTMLRAMLQAMLEDRFKVVTHYENKEAPVYNMVVAKSGPKFKQAETVNADGGMLGTNVRVVPRPDGIQYKGISIAILAQTILPGMAGRPVVDKTALAGNYDLTLPDLKRASMAPVPSGDDESIFTVLPEALGLRLESGKGEVQVLVIDHVERPGTN
jgi:uncharacterized protein (TIGR03435 family)